MTFKKKFLLVFLIQLKLCIASNDSTHSNQLSQIATIKIIKAYQNVSKLIPFEMCIFEPSCSRFAIAAIDRYGTLKGIQITANRIMRCNPSRKFEKDSNHIPFEGKLYDPPNDYVIARRKFSPDFVIPGLFQFRKRKIVDGVMALGFTSIPVYAVKNKKFKLDIGNVLFSLVGLIFYSGHLNYCYTYPR